TGKMLVAILIGLATSVLLIACSNLANVLLAGAIERRRESAVRAALGASRLQLVRPALFEAGLLALAGGSAALIVAAWTSRWLRANLTDAGGIELPLDWRVLGFGALSCLLTAAFVSLAPALFALRTNPNVALSSGGRTLTSGVRQRRLRNALIATQFAFATILLATAGVFLSGTAGLLSKDYGWRSDHVLQGNVQLTADRYRDEADIAAFYARFTDRLRALPGVESASVSYGLPYLGLRGSTNVQAELGGGRRLKTLLNGVSPEYFRVTGTRLVSGRAFTAADTTASAPVIIVSDSLARACFPEQRAEGRRVVVDDDGTLVSMEIVGVVADTESVDIAQSPNRFQLYQAVAQDPRTSAAFAVRTTGVPPQTLASAVRAAVSDLDAGVLVKDVAPADSLVHSLDSQMAIVRQLLAAFAALGLFLALIGIYGVISRMVVQRTAEMGIRMALGAQTAGLLMLIVGAGIRVSGTGVAVGVLGAVAVSRALTAGFPSMQVNTLLVSAGSVTVLLAMAVTVCLLSARRVTTIDPVVALRID
ncbi:MAG: FtsX-like permease family protein, partial [Acidobacteriota bacterium]